MVVLLAAMNQFILQPDQFGNVEKLEMAGMALSLSKLNLTVDGIVLKIKRLLSEESFKKNAERLQFIAKMNILLRDWIVVNTRIGFIRRNYIDAYGAFIIILLALVGGFGYVYLKLLIPLYKIQRLY
ncbi:40885_t:CDS:2 [Gigaspora margarita]|uniref:40885_t:CDS:1 n=1 Tax=Gigaspora margarita TaxID=4874 RepID=A0ABN7UMD4_GIGMA|nr:40885_t:CDS:2 [Gigaspora margarita]